MKAAGEDLRNAFAYCRRNLLVSNASLVYDVAALQNRKSDPCQYRNNHEAIAGFIVGQLFESMGDWDWTEEAKAIRAEALIFYGDHDLAVAESFQEWGERDPQLRVSRLDNTGHEALLEHSEVILRGIDEFLLGMWPSDIVR